MKEDRVSEPRKSTPSNEGIAFGRALTRARLNLGKFRGENISYDSIAAKLNIPTTTYMSYETGTLPKDHHFLQKICALYQPDTETIDDLEHSFARAIGHLELPIPYLFEQQSKFDGKREEAIYEVRRRAILKYDSAEVRGADHVLWSAWPAILKYADDSPETVDFALLLARVASQTRSPATSIRILSEVRATTLEIGSPIQRAYQAFYEVTYGNRSANRRGTQAALAFEPVLTRIQALSRSDDPGRIPRWKPVWNHTLRSMVTVLSEASDLEALVYLETIRDRFLRSAEQSDSLDLIQANRLVEGRIIAATGSFDHAMRSIEATEHLAMPFCDQLFVGRTKITALRRRGDLDETINEIDYWVSRCHAGGMLFRKKQFEALRSEVLAIH